MTTGTINRLAMIAAVLWVASDAKWFTPIADNVEKVHQETIVSGPALVLRGWNVSVAGTKIRLRGVDVAESGTLWGDMATLGMKSIVGSELTCRLTGDKFDDPKYSEREIGYCTKPDGTDIAQELVAKGFALACPRTDDRYVQFEAEGEKSEIRKVMGPQPRSSHCAKRS